MEEVAMVLTPIAEDFERAVQIMRDRGWHQGWSVGPGGSVCAARALNMAVGERAWPSIAHSGDARKALGLYIPVPEWNDQASTTFEDVENRFLAAARRLREAANGR